MSLSNKYLLHHSILFLTYLSVAHHSVLCYAWAFFIHIQLINNFAWRVCTVAKLFCKFVFVLLNNEHNSLRTKTQKQKSLLFISPTACLVRESNLLAQAYNGLGQARNYRPNWAWFRSCRVRFRGQIGGCCPQIDKRVQKKNAKVI